jgi:hypothetical protein
MGNIGFAEIVVIAVMFAIPAVGVVLFWFLVIKKAPPR